MEKVFIKKHMVADIHTTSGWIQASIALKFVIVPKKHIMQRFEIKLVCCIVSMCGVTRATKGPQRRVFMWLSIQEGRLMKEGSYWKKN